MDKKNCPFCKIRREKFTLKEIASDHHDFIIESFMMISLVVKIAIGGSLIRRHFSFFYFFSLIRPRKKQRRKKFEIGDSGDSGEVTTAHALPLVSSSSSSPHHPLSPSQHSNQQRTLSRMETCTKIYRFEKKKRKRKEITGTLLNVTAPND